MDQVQKLDFSLPAAVNCKDRPIAIWLLAVAGLVFAMVLVGGATRLTESGLSIVEWEPVKGTLPPLSDAAWEAEFAKYKQSPQYLKVNHGMSMAEFKTIFWWEWGHRQLGRAIGLAFVAPLLFFWVRGMIRPELKPKLIGLLALGGLQGAMGWFMVMSGLVDRPSVSHYRLAAHLSLAFILYGCLLWLALDLLRPRTIKARADRLFWTLSTVLAVQIVYGAFVAGLRAGLAFNSWPSMDGAFLPAGFLEMDPVWINFVENPGTVQFVHRMLAYLLTGLAALLWWRRRHEVNKSVRLAAHALGLAVLLQVALGIATLVQAVPIGLGVAHQGGALVVVTAFLLFRHERLRS